MRLIDADAQIAPLKAEYKKLKQAFDETSVFQAPNDVALYGTLMQEVGAVIEMIEGAPTVDAVPVRHAYWIRHEDWEEEGGCGWECSECGMGSEVDYKYCMRCGAKMDAERKEE